MSLFGSLMGDFDDDIFGNQMNAMNMQMRSMNRLMNTFMPDPFNMLPNFDGGFQQNALMERQNPHNMGGLFGFPAMPNMNRLISTDIGNNGAAFCSSSVITMSSGPDGRPQIYQATSSTKTGPGGIRETRRTVQDSVNGVKKMAIGHHIGERGHIIEKEQDLRSGQLEEHQEFINLEEDEAEQFDHEFTAKARRSTGEHGGPRAICSAPVPQQALTIEEIDDDDDEVVETASNAPRASSSSSQHRKHFPNISPPSQPPSSSQNHQTSSAKLTTSNSSSATNMSPSSSSSSSSACGNSSSALHTTSIRPSMTSMTSANTLEPLSTTATRSVNNKNSYLTNTPRRSTFRGSCHLIGASPRRPLRTPSSSPLATTPTLHSHSTASAPSVHPHPYNTSAARRSHQHHHNHNNNHHHQHQHQHQHRPKQHAAKQHKISTEDSNKQKTKPNLSQPREEDHTYKEM